MADLTPNDYGHISYVALLAGQALIAGGHARWGFPLRVAGDLGWVAVGIAMGASSIWFWSALFAVADAFGLWSQLDADTAD